MIERDFIFLNCQLGHDWVFIGGKNAGCSDECSCSVPVHRCSVCGDYDYGDNIEAKEKITRCAERKANEFELGELQ